MWFKFAPFTLLAILGCSKGAERDANIAALTEADTTLIDRVAALEAAQLSTSGDVVGLKADVDDLTADVADLGALASDFEGLEARATAADGAVAALTSRVDALEVSTVHASWVGSGVCSCEATMSSTWATHSKLDISTTHGDLLIGTTFGFYGGSTDYPNHWADWRLVVMSSGGGVVYAGTEYAAHRTSKLNSTTDLISLPPGDYTIALQTRNSYWASIGDYRFVAVEIS